MSVVDLLGIPITQYAEVVENRDRILFANSEEHYGGNNESFRTTYLFWDCACEENFIHPNYESFCPRCHAVIEDQPESMLKEVLAEMAAGKLKLYAIQIQPPLYDPPAPPGRVWTRLLTAAQWAYERFNERDPDMDALLRESIAQAKGRCVNCNALLPENGLCRFCATQNDVSQ